MNSREKLRAFNKHKDDRFLFADRALLEEKDPKNEALKLRTARGRLYNEVFYALLDSATVEEILEHREVVSETLNEEEREKTEKAEILEFLTTNEIEFDTDASLEDLRILKTAKEKELNAQKESEEQAEAEKIKNELEKKDINFNPRLGIKKLRELFKKNIEDPQKPQEKTPEQIKAEQEKNQADADAEAKEIREFLTIHNIQYNEKSSLTKLRDLKEKTVKEIQAAADLQEAEEIKTFLREREVAFIPDVTLEQLRNIKQQHEDLHNLGDEGATDKENENDTPSAGSGEPADKEGSEAEKKS